MCVCVSVQYVCLCVCARRASPRFRNCGSPSTTIVCVCGEVHVVVTAHFIIVQSVVHCKCSVVATTPCVLQLLGQGLIGDCFGQEQWRVRATMGQRGSMCISCEDESANSQNIFPSAQRCQFRRSAPTRGVKRGRREKSRKRLPAR